MSIDVTNAGKQIAMQMEAIEKDYEDKDGFQLGGIVTIVEVHGPDGAEFRIRSNTDNPYMTLGIMRASEQQLLDAMRQGPAGAQ